MAFAKENLSPSQCKTVCVPRVEFNYETKTWRTKEYILPFCNNDYVLLTPCDLLTRDETFINRADMLGNLQNIAPSVEDAALRFELNQYFTEVLSKKQKELSKTEKNWIATELIRSHPELIDYYIKYKEDNEEKATSIRACLKNVNMPKRRLFFRHTLPIFLEIHPVFLRQIGFVWRKNS